MICLTMLGTFCATVALAAPLPPTVTSVSPNRGNNTGGNTITITGTDFIDVIGVQIGMSGAATSFTVDSPTQITATVPPAWFPNNVVYVTTPGGTSSTVESDENRYSYINPPMVMSTIPESGPAAGGTVVTIQGANFIDVSSVKFGTVDATSYTVINESQITATAPAGLAGTVEIKVTTIGGLSTTMMFPWMGGFTYYGVPTVTAISPNRGNNTGGNTITITGTNFNGASAVQIGMSGAATSFTVDSPTQITATVPPAWFPNNVVYVTTPGGTSSTVESDENRYSYINPPMVMSTMPDSGPAAGGTVVTIQGANFIDVSSVKFGTVDATSYTVINESQIIATAPAGLAGTVEIKVTTIGGLSTTMMFPWMGGFTYYGVPTVTAISPNRGNNFGGNTITITGTNFNGASAVQIGMSGAATSFTVDSPTQITATVPPAWFPNNVVYVTTPGGTSSTVESDENRYSYINPPMVMTVSPPTGPSSGGTIVTIQGANFIDVSSVKFGTVDATSYTVINESQITATAPAGLAGTVEIKVTTIGGLSTTMMFPWMGGFTAIAPPTAASIVRLTPLTPITNEPSVTWRVTFSDNVSGVDLADFSVNGYTSGILSLSPVTAMTYDVTLATITSDGTVRLDVRSDATIQGTFASMEAGGYTLGESFTLSGVVPPLQKGDIAVIGMNSDDNEDVNEDSYQDARWALVAIANLPVGAIIHITDAGINEEGAFYASSTNEGHLTWTLTTPVAAGTVLVMDTSTGLNNSDLNGAADGSGGLSDYGSVVGHLGGTSIGTGIPFNTSGDQLIIYQGTAGTTTDASFIYAFSTQQNGLLTAPGTWQTSDTVTSSQQSYLPAGLINGGVPYSANALTSHLANASIGNGLFGTPNYGFDNMVYQGTRAGSREQLLSAIANPANWIGNNADGHNIGLGGGYAIASHFTLGEVINAEPTDLSLSPASINLSAAIAGAVVGTLTTTDEDIGDTFTYSLVTGAGDEHNALFTLSGNSLLIGASPLLTGTYNVRIRTLDSAYHLYEEAFVVTVVDNIAPTVTNVTSTTTDGTYKTNDTITLTVTFDEEVYVTGVPTLGLNSGGSASYSSGSETNTLTFTYLVAAGHATGDLDSSSVNALALNEGALTDQASNPATLTLPTLGGPSSIAGQKAIVIDTTVPEIMVEHPEEISLADGESIIPFGSVAHQNSGPAKIVRIYNSGNANLTLSSIATVGGNSDDFIVNTSGTSLTLAPLTATTFSVVFSPSSLDGRMTTLRISSNDADEASFDITLTGTGVNIVGGIVSFPPIPFYETDGFQADGLNLFLELIAPPTSGMQIPIVNNTGEDPIEGIFNGLPDGGSIKLKFDNVLYLFTADYEGGDGNDLVLDLALPIATNDATADTGFATFDTIWGGVVSPAGDFSFRAFLNLGSGTPAVTTSSYTGIWKGNVAGTYQLLARTGGPVGGVSDAVFSQLPAIPWINTSGQVSFYGAMQVGQGGVTSSNDTGIWSEIGGALNLVLREDDEVPGLDGISVMRLSSSMGSSQSGRLVVPTTLKGTGVTGGNNSALLVADIGESTTTVDVLAREGSPAPGTGINFSELNGSFSDPRVNSSGEIAFSAVLATGGTGIWHKGTTTPLGHVAVTGQIAPGTAQAEFYNIEMPALADNGIVAFRAFVTPGVGDNPPNGSKTAGVWKGLASNPASLAPVVRQGDVGLPGMNPDSSVWAQWPPFVNDVGNVAFELMLKEAGNQVGYGICTDSSGTAAVVAKTGDVATGTSGATFNYFRQPVIGDAGDTAFVANLVTGGEPNGNDLGAWKHNAANGISLLLRVGDQLATSSGAKTVADINIPSTTEGNRRFDSRVIDGKGRVLLILTFTDGSSSIVFMP